MSPVKLLGADVDPLTIAELNAVIEEAILNGKQWIIANHNLHSIYLYHHDPKMREYYKQAKVIHIDGMPLLQWGRFMGHHLNQTHRVTYLDWLYPLLEESRQKGWRIFYLGGKPGVAEHAAQILTNQLPGLHVRAHHGYFTEKEKQRILDEIAGFQSQILMVGMGMPFQEHWILDNLEFIQVNAILNAGACFDYVAGAVPVPPRWMGRIGFEWLYRLMNEPGRLAKRYLWEPWFLIPHMVKDMFFYYRKKMQ